MSKVNVELNTLQAELREEMQRCHGPLLGGPLLLGALGLPSAAALRQARHRGQVAVTLFTLPQRRGVYALTRDVADWLASARLGADHPHAFEKGAPHTEPPDHR